MASPAMLFNTANSSLPCTWFVTEAPVGLKKTAGAVETFVSCIHFLMLPEDY